MTWTAGFRSPALPPSLVLRRAKRICGLSALHSTISNGGAAQPGCLYLVSTPIGNKADITFRAVSVLSTVDIIAAEDTRRTGLLLKDILKSSPRTSQLLSCHEHNVRERSPQLLSSLRARKSVALVSDAGTPCISDPGRELVAAAIAADVPVVPVPGACAALSALVCTGFALNTFTFAGFLPRAGAARTAALERVAGAAGAVVLYEAPHRLRATLAALAAAVGPTRALCVGREMTKRYEEFRRFPSAADAAAWYDASEAAPRGEFVLVLGPAPPAPKSPDLEEFAGAEVNVRSMALALLEEGVPVKAISKSISAVAKVPKKAVYAFVSELKSELLEGAESRDT